MAKMHKAKGKMRQRSWQSVLVLTLVCFSRMFFWPTTCRNLVWFLFTVVVHAHWKHWECCEVLPTRHWLGCLVRASSEVYGDLIFPISNFFYLPMPCKLCCAFPVPCSQPECKCQRKPFSEPHPKSQCQQQFVCKPRGQPQQQPEHSQLDGHEFNVASPPAFVRKRTMPLQMPFCMVVDTAVDSQK